MFFQISKLHFLLYQKHFLQFNTFCYAEQSALTVEVWKQISPNYHKVIGYVNECNFVLWITYFFYSCLDGSIEITD